jgi:carboxyl-terminal processing protease
LERFKRGEQFIKDSIHVNSNLSYSTLKKGRKVYGGGGIFPDVFVPMDTTKTTEYQQKLIRMGVFNSFTLDYLDTHRKALKDQYPDLEKYIQKFVVDDVLLAAFVKHGEEKKVNCDTAQLQRSKELIKIQLKALISRDVYGMSAYFQVINPVEDDAYNQAEKILKDWKIAKKKYL